MSCFLFYGQKANEKDEGTDEKKTFRGSFASLNKLSDDNEGKIMKNIEFWYFFMGNLKKVFDN